MTTPAPSLAQPARELAAAYNGETALSGRVSLLIAPEPGDGWLHLADLLHPGRAADVVAAAAALCGGCETAVSRTAAAGLMLGDLTSAFATVVTGTLLTQRRALVLDATTARVRYDETGISGVGAATAQVWCLPGDTVGAPATDLYRVAADGYVQLLAPFVDLIAGEVRRGRRALWADVTDRFTAAAFRAARVVDPASARSLVDAIVDRAPEPVRHRVPWIETSEGPWPRRTVCCLAYQTPRWADCYCATCPLVTPEETARRVQEPPG